MPFCFALKEVVIPVLELGEVGIVLRQQFLIPRLNELHLGVAVLLQESVDLFGQFPRDHRL